ncbi:MAG TPA: tetratricopeptide repeat protein [Thermoanaerobaculia bacterium]|nr:tetratricopeptide repeat protein [Thermoanaerobaculia bacterium]
MRTVALLMISLTFWRDTSSTAAAARGAKQYAAKQYAQSAASFRRAHELAPSAGSAFDLGTAQIAAGQRELGSATLAEAIKDPKLRADALYNRGNSALAAKALDHAIADYENALRANPNHAAAKRNLEIALQRFTRQQQQTSSSGQKNQQGQQPNKPQQQSSGGKQQPKPGQVDLDALLRSVQQQELDELRRMKGQVSADGRVGW